MVSIFLSTLWKFFVSTILKITTKLWSVRNQKTKYKPFPPGPKPWPIVRCLPQMLLNKKPASQWIHKLMEEMGTEIACICLGNVHVILVTSPELACDFLKRSLGKRLEKKNKGPSHVEVEEDQVFIDAIFTLLEYLHAFSISRLLTMVK